MSDFNLFLFFISKTKEEGYFGVSCRGWLLGALFVCSCSCIVGPRSWAGFPYWSVPFGVSCRCLRCYTFSHCFVSLCHGTGRGVYTRRGTSAIYILELMLEIIVALSQVFQSEVIVAHAKAAIN